MKFDHVLIADTDSEFCYFSAEVLRRNGLAHQVYVTGEMAQAVHLIEQGQIQLLITDFLLHQGNGMALVRLLKKQQGNAGAIMCSTLLEEDIFNVSALNVADVLLCKPCDDERLVQEVGRLLRGDKRSVDIRTLELQVAHMIRDCGVSARCGGYRYMKQALLRTILSPTGTDGITKEIYPDIAKMYNTKSDSVERSIRYLIKSSWQPQRREQWSPFLPGELLKRDKCPSNSEVLSAMAEWYFLSYGSVVKKKIL